MQKLHAIKNVAVEGCSAATVSDVAAANALSSRGGDMEFKGGVMISVVVVLNFTSKMASNLKARTFPLFGKFLLLPLLRGCDGTPKGNLAWLVISTCFRFKFGLQLL